MHTRHRYRSHWTTALTVLLATLFAFASCREQPQDNGDTPPTPVVYTVNYPLKYFAERIGGGVIDVEFPAPAGVDPAFWNPDPDTIARYQRADLVLRNGASYAGWVDRTSLPPSRLVDTTAAVRDRLLEIDDAVTHTHGPTGEHAHGELAFTTWLDPTLALAQAQAIAEAMAARWPAHADRFRQGLALLEADLLALDATYSGIVGERGDLPIVVSHPVYQYFVRRYGLNARSVHWEPDEPPDEAMQAELEALLADHPATWMIWEGEPVADAIGQLSTLGVRSAVLDPCANVPERGDWLEVMRANADWLRPVFEGQ